MFVLIALTTIAVVSAVQQVASEPKLIHIPLDSRPRVIFVVFKKFYF